MEISIKKAIIHILNRDSSEPIFSEFELEINEDIYELLYKHIIKSVNDDEARKAMFKQGRNIIFEVCNKMVREQGYFLEGSKEIAIQLFKAMKTNNNISSTDLIICWYESDGDNSIAIFKMDYNTTFVHDVKKVDEKFKISILKQEISLPGVNQRIQKCAFINDSRSSHEYDLIILDNQMNKKNEEDSIAQFFLETFLGAELILDNKQKTKIFKTETENWIKSKSKEGENSVEEIREIVYSAMHDEDEIDIESFTQRAFGNKQDLKQEYISNLQDKGFNDKSFEVDKEWVDKKLSKIRLKTETNIEIVLDYEAFNDKNKFEVVKNANGTKSILIKNINNIFEK